MKKLLVIIILMFFIVGASTFLFLKNLGINEKEIIKQNQEFEYYLNKKIYGTELVSIINKAIDKNEQNKILKDEKKYYVENEENSLKIEIKMGKINKTYPMEEIYNNNITEFVKYFNLAEFECIKIEYHKKTGRISKMYFQEV